MSPAPARLRHVPQLAAILWSFTRDTPWLPQVRSRRTDLGLLTKVVRRGWVRLIRDGRGPAGFIARDGARVHAIYVHPRARGKGLGRLLLDDAKSCADRLELYVVQANKPARQFYAAQGFAEVSRSSGVGNDENLPDILMVWPPHKPAPEKAMT